MAASYTFEDLSGATATSASDNPYDGLIEACHNNAVRNPFPTQPTYPIQFTHHMILNKPLSRLKFKLATKPTVLREQHSKEKNSHRLILQV
jgi:transposase